MTEITPIKQRRLAPSLQVSPASRHRKNATGLSLNGRTGGPLSYAQAISAPRSAEKTADLMFLSGKKLDLCLLFVCSCVLTLLCHHISGIHPTLAVKGVSSTNAPGAILTEIDFLIKAGLKTSLQEDAVIEDDE